MVGVPPPTKRGRGKQYSAFKHDRAVRIRPRVMTRGNSASQPGRTRPSDGYVNRHDNLKTEILFLLKQNKRLCFGPFPL
jgi:hypothetical protein